MFHVSKSGMCSAKVFVMSSENPTASYVLRRFKGSPQPPNRRKAYWIFHVFQLQAHSFDLYSQD
jgi:hypothetical protein